MKPTVKLFLALAEEQERPIHIAHFVFDVSAEVLTNFSIILLKKKARKYVLQRRIVVRGNEF